MASSEPVNPERFMDGMRGLAEGVCIVTTSLGTIRLGMTVTAFSSLSIQPPSLLICINKNSESHDLIVKTHVFCINVLTQSHVDLAIRFSGQVGLKGEERFGHGAWTLLVTGAPVLRDSIASFDCELFAAHEAATHTIFLGTVVDMLMVQDPNAQPLIYTNRTYGKMAEKPL